MVVKFGSLGRLGRSLSRQITPPQYRYRLAVLIITALALSFAALLPLVVVSAFGEITAPASNRLYRLTSADVLATPTRIYLHLDLVGVNEWEHTATLRVSGYSVCDTACRWTDQVLLVSLPGLNEDSGGLPPSRH
jgi:hypothetical protein